MDPLIESPSPNQRYLDIENRELTESRLRTISSRRKAVQTDSDSLITPRFILRVLWQWWYILIPISVILATASATAVFLTFTPIYRATAVVQIASHAPYIAYEMREPVEKSEEFVETQIELLQSQLVLEPVVTKPEIATIPQLAGRDALPWLSQHVQVAQVGHSELYEVSIACPNPEHAAMLVNSVMDSYFSVRARDDQLKNQRVLELLEQEQQASAELVLQLREKMRELSKDIVGKDPFTEMPTGEGARRMRPLESLQETLTKVEVDRKMLEVELKALEESIKEEDSLVREVELEMALGETDEIRQLQNFITTKKLNLHRVETTAAQGKESTAYRRLERELNDLERQLQVAVATARPQVKSQLQSVAKLDGQDAVDQSKKKLESLKLQESMWREQYTKQLAEVSKSDNKSLELEFTRSELARHEKVFELIAERSMALNTEMRAPGRVAMLRRAEAPDMPVEKIPLRNMALAIFASGCLPFGLVLLWELSVRRISDVDQLTQQSELRVVGEIAKIPLHRRLGGLRRTHGLNLFEESIDSLRVCLWLPESHKNVQVLAVVSAVHGEGKTSVASQLAVSVARSTGERTLLIDADMRSPDIFQIFKIPNEPGLAQLLDGNSSIEDSIVTSWSDQVHLLPAGKLHKSPHKLLGGPAMSVLINELRSHYRYIVIDTPPILSAAESLLLAKLADGTIVCTMRNYSRERQVKLAYQRLIAAGARPLGAVFNAVPTRRYAYTYGTYDYTRHFG